MINDHFVLSDNLQGNLNVRSFQAKARARNPV